MAYLYQNIAEKIKADLQSGYLPLNEKIPSVRALSNRLNCSVSVVLQAYKELEKQGCILSKEKSGYFPVSEYFSKLSSKSGKIDSLHLPPKVQVQRPEAHSIIGQVIEATLDPTILPIGGGVPSPEILPIKSLQKSLNKATKQWSSLMGEYTLSQGSWNLRKQICKLMHTRGVEVNPGEIIITNGCMEALVLAIRHSTQVGDVVAVEYPMFFGLISVLQDLGRKIVEIPVHPHQGLDLAKLSRAIDIHPIKAVVSSATLQNPMGFSTSREHKKQLVEICENQQIRLIEDDVYGECLFQPDLLRPLKHFDTSGNVMYCSSFSKTTCPGYRLGWIIPGKGIENIEKAKMSQTLGGPSLIQEAMALFLEEGGYSYHIKKFRKSIAQHCFEYRQTILDYFPIGTQVSDPKGGFFLWIELPKSLNKNMVDLFPIVLKELSIAYIPGPTFCSNHNSNNIPLSSLSSCFRINCGFPMSPQIKDGLISLGHFLKKE